MTTEIWPTHHHQHTTPPGGSVLLLEDDDIVRRLVSKMLKHLDLRVQCATSAQEAQALCESHRGEFELFLVDYGLRQSPTGADFLNWAHPRYPGSRRILMSGLSFDDLNRLEDLHTVCDDVLSKPFDLEELRRQLGAQPLTLGGIR